MKGRGREWRMRRTRGGERKREEREEAAQTREKGRERNEKEMR